MSDVKAKSDQKHRGKDNTTETGQTTSLMPDTETDPQAVPRTVAGVVVDGKGKIINEKGEVIGEISGFEEGQSLTGNLITSTGNVVNEAGDVLGKASFHDDAAKELAEGKPQKAKPDPMNAYKIKDDKGWNLKGKASDAYQIVNGYRVPISQGLNVAGKLYQGRGSKNSPAQEAAKGTPDTSNKENEGEAINMRGGDGDVEGDDTVKHAAESTEPDSSGNTKEDSGATKESSAADPEATKRGKDENLDDREKKDTEEEADVFVDADNNDENVEEHLKDKDDAARDGEHAIESKESEDAEKPEEAVGEKKEEIEQSAADNKVQPSTESAEEKDGPELPKHEGLETMEPVPDESNEVTDTTDDNSRDVKATPSQDDDEDDVLNENADPDGRYGAAKDAMTTKTMTDFSDDITDGLHHHDKHKEDDQEDKDLQGKPHEDEGIQDEQKKVDDVKDEEEKVDDIKDEESKPADLTKDAVEEPEVEEEDKENPPAAEEEPQATVPETSEDKDQPADEDTEDVKTPTEPVKEDETKPDTGALPDGKDEEEASKDDADVSEPPKDDEQDFSTEEAAEKAEDSKETVDAGGDGDEAEDKKDDALDKKDETLDKKDEALDKEATPAASATKPDAAEQPNEPEQKKKSHYGATKVSDEKLAAQISEAVGESLDKMDPICKQITEKVNKAEKLPKSQRNEKQLADEVQGLIEQGNKILTSTNTKIRKMDPDGRIQKQAKEASAKKIASPLEQRLAQQLHQLTGTVTSTIDNAKKKVNDMPVAKKQLQPFWAWLTEPLVEILAAVGLLLSGVLGLVGKLLRGFGLGFVVDRVIGALPLKGILSGLGIPENTVDAILGGGKDDKSK